MIVNTGRGQLIHTNALIEGLKNKKIGCAGLDVYEEESEYFYEDQSDKIIDDDTLALPESLHSTQPQNSLYLLLLAKPNSPKVQALHLLFL